MSESVVSTARRDISHISWSLSTLPPAIPPWKSGENRRRCTIRDKPQQCVWILRRSALFDLSDNFLGELGALGWTSQVASDHFPFFDHLQKKYFWNRFLITSKNYPNRLLFASKNIVRIKFAHRRNYIKRNWFDWKRFLSRTILLTKCAPSLEIVTPPMISFNDKWLLITYAHLLALQVL